ncbi:hypothetical protein [Paraliomyxa miuraensis]|uniref:hypothetical protein n=1 Tax=Paraliomyxa miuraensis TaxID=376150 RepID=UPI00224ECDBC|nr:hypothetical protein [Paraliomyxa miuraensis]MCX4247659.1 hypothetical protein [Paraliomyxa miuraensis]
MPEPIASVPCVGRCLGRLCAHHARPGRRSLALALTLAAGCVYPASEPTGVELSWRFVEQGAPDGSDDGEPRLRTCAGAVTEQLAFEITDTADPRRHGIFRFDCELGYQTDVELQTSASDAFVELAAGTYQIAAQAVDDATNAVAFEVVSEREVEVSERGVTVEIWALRRAPVPWSLELRGAGSCDSLTLALNHVAPEIDLVDEVPIDDAPLLYRETLHSDRGLSLGGHATACGTALEGLHRFEGIDRGEYLLQIDVDGTTCPLRIDLRAPDGGSGVIDLASLPCQG